SSEFLLGATRLGRAERLSATTAALAASPVFVKVGGLATEVNITRDGGKVPSVALDVGVVADIIGSLPTRPRLKVVRQSVEEGRAVERGATVDLVLAQTADLPGAIVDGIHPGLRDRQLGTVFATFVDPNPDVLRILRTKTDASSLTVDERQMVAGVLNQGGVDVSADDPSDFAAAFTGLQAANLFGR